jgi:hypothetical protein
MSHKTIKKMQRISVVIHDQDTQFHCGSPPLINRTQLPEPFNGPRSVTSAPRCGTSHPGVITRITRRLLLVNGSATLGKSPRQYPQAIDEGFEKPLGKNRSDWASFSVIQRHMARQKMLLFLKNMQLR